MVWRAENRIERKPPEHARQGPNFSRPALLYFSSLITSTVARFLQQTDMALIRPRGDDRMARLLGNTRRRVNWVVWVGLLIALVILSGAALWLASLVVPSVIR